MGYAERGDRAGRLLTGVSIAVLTWMTASAVQAQEAKADSGKSEGAQVSEVVVTGSRVIRNGNDSPTPLTTVTAEALQLNTPSNIPDALNKLPVFIGSRNPRSTGGSVFNNAGNFLNLRRVGTNRSLILLDGMRVPASEAAGSVDINTLPQTLLERVDVVTGGASAVYGSDAITGVVNFVLNKKFNGLEVAAQTGTSWLKDNDSWRASVTAGTNLGDRGHVEFSYEHYDADGVPNMMTRELGPKVYQELGAGTAANPYRLVANVRNTNLSPNGYITTGPLKELQFVSNGVLAPFVHGLPGNGVNEIGGDGGYAGMSYFLFPGVDANPWLATSLKTDRVFGRFDYDFSDSVHGFVQGNYSHAEQYNISFVKNFQARFAADNAFLPQSARDILAASGTTNFTMSKALADRRGDVSFAPTTSVTFATGLNGKLGSNFDWEVHYVYGRTQLHERMPDTTNNQKLFAALDAVTDPSTGRIVCRVSLNPTSAALYPGCQPFNAFGPNADSDSAFDYITDDLDYRVTNTTSDVAGSISGDLFQGWAGPIRGAVSGEWREITLQAESAYAPTAKVDCTGQNPLTCDSSKAIWNGVIANLPKKSETVSEGAVELEVPLLANVPLVKQLNLNAAARYTKYSISGVARTWKLGGVWDVNDDLKIRATRSRDIRAPNLNDLFAAQNANFSAFTDFLTGVSATTTVSSSGNPNLKPEIASTTTAGLVYRPHQLPGFSVSVDWYKIRINNVITSINGGSATVQQICIASAGTSQYCSLVDRPFPITNTTPANYPTMIRSQPLNSGYLLTDGVDAEVGYRFDLANLHTGLPGRMDLRAMYSYQPTFKSFTGITGAVITNQAGAQGSNGTTLPDKRFTFTALYDTGPFSVSVLQRWHDKTRNNDNPTLIYSDPLVAAVWLTDLSLRYKFEVDGHKVDTFLSIENLFNRKPSAFIGSGRTGAEGYAYPASFDDDVIGRYFTAGVRAKF